MKNIYLEITNICNLRCSFCHGTERAKKMLSEGEFCLLLEKLKGRGEYLFFHLMGEPLLHPQLPLFISLARESGFKPCLTTNGTLLKARGEELAASGLHRISISLHAPEGNGLEPDEDYLSACTGFALSAASNGSYVALRLWNGGGAESANPGILSFLQGRFPQSWVPTRSGFRMADRIFLETGERFDWPDLSAAEYEGELFCHGLRDQIGVLCNGTVVPCCLDAEGTIALGNLFHSSLEEILTSPRAKAMYDGFTARRPVEELCRRCGYAALKKMH